MPKRAFAIACTSILLICSGAPGFAAEGELPAAIKACTTIPRSAERLVCFDRAAQALMSGESSTSAEVEPAKTQEEMFGIPAERPATLSAPSASQPSELESIRSEVQALRTAPDGALLIDLANGQVWRQEEEKQLLLKPGDTVKIVRGALKSFRMVTPAQRIARVRRIR